MEKIPIACNLNAIPPEQRPHHQQLYDSVFSQFKEIVELEEGYRFSFPVETLPQIAAYISMERLCCPFFTFRLELLPAAHTLTLDLCSSEDIKAFLREELGETGLDRGA